VSNIGPLFCIGMAGYGTRCKCAADTRLLFELQYSLECAGQAIKQNLIYV
jgi:hypothetical protein